MTSSASALAAVATAIASGGIRVVDLTQPLSPKTPVIPLPPQFGQAWPFEMELISKYDERGPAWYWYNFKTSEHTGTHFDAPVHWITGKDQPDNCTDTIPPRNFIGPACVIDCSADASTNHDFLLTVERVQAWEGTHGRVPKGAWVLMRTDWSKRTDPAAYLNAKEDGCHAPGPHPDLVPFLINEREVLGFGNEAVGTDAGQAFAFDPPFPCHAGMHGANRYGLASLCNLDQLPATGAVVIAPPLKIVGGSGSPCRVLALVPGA